jgi:hypothetical protein
MKLQRVTAKVNWHKAIPYNVIQFCGENPFNNPSGGSTIFMLELLIFCVLN